MVLTQQDKVNDYGKTYTSFHTTMVLTQLSVSASGSATSGRFPYHYGSHATHVRRGLTRRRLN